MNKKRTKIPDNKGWASFRIRGIKTSLDTLINNDNLSASVKIALHNALISIDEAVYQLDKEKQND